MSIGNPHALAFIHLPNYVLIQDAADASHIWIRRTDNQFEGEGGRFNAADLERAIDAFYTEHF